MVYIKHWPEYQAAALGLLQASPEKVRSFLPHNHQLCELVRFGRFNFP